MSRVVIEDVKDIFDTTMSDSSIEAFITSATNIVSNGPALSPVGLGADELKEIERYVAAHLCCLMDPREIRHKTGDAEAWFQPNVTTAFGQGLRFTNYGQMALVLDRSGTLAKLGMMKASFRVSPREDSKNYTPKLTKS